MTREPLTTGEVAEYCHVTYRAVLKWIAEGKIKAYRTPGKHSRVNWEDFLEFLKKYNMPLPQDALSANGKMRVLIVDDHKEIVSFVRGMLTLEFKFEVKEAYDGFNAGRILAEYQPHLVILDINMPGMDGKQVCAQIRKDPQNKDVKIIVISGSMEENLKQEVLKLGANDFLAKPFEYNQLKEKVEKLLNVKGISQAA